MPMLKPRSRSKPRVQTVMDRGLLHIRVPGFLRAWVLAESHKAGLHPAAFIADILVAEKQRRDASE